MALKETEGLILKSYNLSDADKIVIFMTERDGVIRGVAKGAKRLKSKFSGRLEPFSIVNLVYYQNEDRELVSIRQIELEKSFFKQAGDISFLQNFSYLTELLIEFSPPHDPNERLYRMARVCLEAAAENEIAPDSVVFYFELWLLRLGGYLPVWEKCQRCQRVLEADESTNLQMDFQLVCHRCQNQGQKNLITPKVRLTFLDAQKMSPQRFSQSASASNQEIREISNILRRIICAILGKEPFAKRVLQGRF